MDKVKLRKFKMADAVRMLSLLKNDKVLRNLLTNTKAKDLTLEKEKEWLKRVESEYKQKKPEGYHLAIVYGSEVVGSIGAKNIDYNNMKSEIGYWIGEEYWGKGITTRAIKIFVRILFNNLGLVRIEASPFSFNKASQRVLEKAGFKYEGLRRKAVIVRGKSLDDVLYAKVR